VEQKEIEKIRRHAQAAESFVCSASSGCCLFLVSTGGFRFLAFASYVRNQHFPNARESHPQNSKQGGTMNRNNHVSSLPTVGTASPIRVGGSYALLPG
jgi:hypothetical protein